MIISRPRSPRPALYGAVPRGFGAVTDSALPTTDAPFVAGARSVYVAQVQQELADNGYDPGPIDGVVGPDTLNAFSDALAALGKSPSPEARSTVGANISSSSELAAALPSAFAWDAEARGIRGTPGPTAPEQTIAMGPSDAAAAAAKYGIDGASTVPWGWIGLGAAVAGIGGGLLWLARK